MVRRGLSEVVLCGATAVLLLLAGTGHSTATAGSAVPGTRPAHLPPARVRNTALAQRSLAPYYTASGDVSLSLDAAGTNDPAGALIRVQKPAGATLRKAFLFAASTGFTGYEPTNSDVTLDGHAVTWNPSDTIDNGIDSVNVAADVTTLVKNKVAAGHGEIDFTVAEPNNTESIDGEILAVVFNDPNVTTPDSVTLLYGAQSTDGDSFSVALGQPIDKSDPNFALDLSLGISYGYQPDGQYSTIDVNGTRMTTSAGGQDDGGDENGSLITVGGIGDLTDNPPDPFADDFDCEGFFGPAPRCDDELYSLLPFVDNGDTSVNFTTDNPSADDNIFFAALTSTDNLAVVLPGITLAPDDTSGPPGHQHTLSATVKDASNAPVAGVDVQFSITSGPNRGRVFHATTNGAGVATYAYTSNAGGVDHIVASATDDLDNTYTSNEVTSTWYSSGWAPGGSPSSPQSQELADAAAIGNPTECEPNSALLFRVRGSGESPGGDFLGAWTAAAGQELIANGWRVRDMQADYPAPSVPLVQLAIAAATRNPVALVFALADLKHYRDAVTKTWTGVRDALVRAYLRCPQRSILVSGYSLGGIVLRYVIPNLPPEVRARIARVDLVADPTEQGSVDAAMVHDGLNGARRTDEGIDTWAARKPNPFFQQTPYPDDIAGVTHQYCAPFDLVCEANPVNLLTPTVLAGEPARHKSYHVAAIGRAAADALNAQRSW